MIPTTLQFADATDGTRIAFSLREADPGLPRLAFLHTLGMSHALWTPVCERLAGRASFLCLDMRGHGASDKPAGPYTPGLLARDLHDVLDHVGWSDAVVVGSSLGGCIAQQFAADHPERIIALGLVDTTAWYGPDAAQHWDARALRARKEGLAAMVEFQQTRWFSDAFREARPDTVDACVQTFLRNDVESFAALSEMLGRFDARSLLARISVPTGIVVGEEDYATTVTMAQALQRAIPEATLTVVPAARHLTQIERPDAVASMLLRLMAGLRPASGPRPRQRTGPSSAPATHRGGACP
ncbi:MAG: alpha/beta fold hydrolase [Comamonadaceae bacterium]|nr:MAG: alpha/beta fold hydrolase [Comamonadaceae bacterium]